MCRERMEQFRVELRYIYISMIGTEKESGKRLKSGWRLDEKPGNQEERKKTVGSWGVSNIGGLMFV